MNASHTYSRNCPVSPFMHAMVNGTCCADAAHHSEAVRAWFATSPPAVTRTAAEAFRTAMVAAA